MLFGFSARGMLGQGIGINHSLTPEEVKLPFFNRSSKKERVISVSADFHYALALASTGNVYL